MPALDRYTINPDAAYGFPPFRNLAPAITIAGMDYAELRAAERQILASFLSHVRVRTLASNTFSWADDIPRLLSPLAGMAPGGPLPGKPARSPAVSPLFEADAAPVDAMATATARLTVAAASSRPQAYLTGAGSDAPAPPDLPLRRAELVPGAPSGRLGTLRTRLVGALAVTAIAVPA